MSVLDGIRIGLAQFDSRTGDVDGNAERIGARIREARERGLDLVVFPEMALTAYCLGDRHKERSFVERSQAALERLAGECRGVTAVVGHIGYDPSRTMRDGFFGRYDSYSVLGEGRVLATGAKRIRIDDGVLDDSRHYLPGEEVEPHAVTIGGREIRLGVLVCQDMWDDGEAVRPAEILAGKGADLLVAVNSSPFFVGKWRRRLATARRRVLETGLPLVYCNAVGVQDNGKNLILFDGASFALDGEGRIVRRLGRFREELGEVAPGEAGEPADPEIDRIRELHDALLMGVRGFYEKTGVFSGAVLGLSGGIDSAVDACLLVEALGPDRVLAVNMPSRYNSETTRSLAAELAANLGVRYLVHPIQEVIDRKVADYERINGTRPRILTLENMQARERGNILMQYSQELGLMVVGNGNKTEFQRGYATLYGDIIGALMPLGDVNKLDVYRLGRWINRDREIIPERVFGIRASAELSAAQSVDSGGGDPFDYWIESPLGVELVENLRSPEELGRAFASRSLDPDLWTADPEGRTVYDKFTPEEFERQARETLHAIRASVFKRVQAPPIIIVSRRAFGFDYRETLL